MATSEIWLTPNGAPSLTLVGNKPTTSSKADWYEKTFPFTKYINSALTTTNSFGYSTIWPFSGDGWNEIGTGLHNGSFSNRSIIGVNLKRESYQTVSLGPERAMSNDNASGNWARDVVGVSFVYDRKSCYWSVADIKIGKVGIRYWDIKTETEITEITYLEASGGNHPPDQSSDKGNKEAPPALAIYRLNQNSIDWHKNQNTICIGFYIQYHIWAPGGYGGSGRDHYIGICELAPVHQNDSPKCKPIAPKGPWAPNDESIRIS